MELYIFGSFCRGEIDKYSDIDLLVIKGEREDLPQFELEKYSIYNCGRIIKLWNEGNPFAWHLFTESKLIFSNNNESLIQKLGEPAPYKSMENDLNKFHKLFLDSKNSLINNKDSLDFDLSMIFLAIRNFASCFSLGFLNKFNFSRRSAINIGVDSINLSPIIFETLEKSRILSTRGLGQIVGKDELENIINEFEKIENWFDKLLLKTKI